MNASELIELRQRFYWSQAEAARQPRRIDLAGEVKQHLRTRNSQLRTGALVIFFGGSQA